KTNGCDGTWLRQSCSITRGMGVGKNMDRAKMTLSEDESRKQAAEQEAMRLPIDKPPAESELAGRIEDLTRSLLALGRLVETAIARSVTSLFRRDHHLAETVIKDDAKIDA